MSAKLAPKPFTQFHKDGSIWAKGQTLGDVPTGYWEWFRKDGTKLRSGTFEAGEQIGTWTTYDKKGAVYKVTEMKPKRAAAAPRSARKTKPAITRQA
jgi:hypothetical protein